MVILFSFLLILGIIFGQVFDFSRIREILTLITSSCLAYIMIEVGWEFSIENRSLRSYRWDAFVSFIAAILPAILWFIYFFQFLKSPWQSSMLAALSSAPTSAGVLFSMMMAAGLGATWIFKKARVLAVLDDLATILLLIPLQIIIHGFEWESIAVLLVIFFFVFVSFRWKNSISWPVTEQWFLVYAVGLSGILFLIKNTTNIHLEVLIPAFMWGCLLRFSGEHHVPAPRRIPLDAVIKGAFMFLVGLSLPKVDIGTLSWSALAGHVFVLTVLANVGKTFPFLCYRKEVSWKQRLALSVAMFPRGEVGAAVLLIGVGYGLGGYENTLAVLSLALNLILTGIFIGMVMRLLKEKS